MKHIRYLILIVLGCGIWFSSSAQYDLNENKVWIFTLPAGLDFNNPAPVPFIHHRIPLHGYTSAHVGAASVADTSGRLVLSSSGTYIWNRLGQRMNNGDVLHPFLEKNWSPGNKMGTVIVPKPGNDSIYYVFSLGGNHWGVHLLGMGRLFYSVVDMRLNNGLGDVAPGQAGVVLDSQLTNKMVAVRGLCNNVWLIVLDRSDKFTHRFKAYEITRSGLNTHAVSSLVITNPLPFTSLTGGLEFHGGGNSFRAASDGSKLVSCDIGSIFGTRLEIFDFDPATGAVSNQVDIGNSDTSRKRYLAAAFSPDNSKIYAIREADTGAEIFQFDITSGISSSIKATQQFIGTCASSSAMPADIRLGPDGRMYFPSILNNYMLNRNYTIHDPHTLGVISNPDQPGALCDLRDSAVSIFFDSVTVHAPWGISIRQMHYPTEIVKALKSDTAFRTVDTGFCQDSITLTAPSGYHRYSWDDGSDGDTRTVDRTGIFQVMSYRYCDFRVDTFYVRRAALTTDLGADTLLCNQPFYTLDVLSADSDATYLWQDGSDSSRFTATHPGAYHVTVSNRYCSASDTILVDFAETRPELGTDTLLCTGTLLDMPLQAGGAADAVSLVWNTGSTDRVLSVRDSGTYWVTAMHPRCLPEADTVHIALEICDCRWMMPQAFTPNGDGRNDRFRPVLEPGCDVHNFRLQVYNRWGQLIYSGNDPDAGWDGRFNGMPADAGTYMYEMVLETGTKRKRHAGKGDISLIR